MARATAPRLSACGAQRRSHRHGQEPHALHYARCGAERACSRRHPRPHARCSIRNPCRPDPPVVMVIPSRSNVVPSPAAGTTPSQRDQHIQMIPAKERLGWQRAVGCSRRSHAETAMFRCKAVIGQQPPRPEPADPENRGQGRLPGAEPVDPPRHAGVPARPLKPPWAGLASTR